MSNPREILCLLPFDVRYDVYMELSGQDFTRLAMLMNSPMLANDKGSIREEVMDVVYRVIYRDINSPQELISHFPRQANGAVCFPLLNTQEHTNELTLKILPAQAAQPNDPDFVQFSIKAHWVSSFRWLEGLEHVASWANAIQHLVSLRGPAHITFPNLRRFMVSCDTTDGARAILPCLSPAVQELDLALGPDVDNATAVACLARAGQVCVGTTSFTLTLAEGWHLPRDANVKAALVATIAAMPLLRQVTLPKSMYTTGLHDTLAQLALPPRVKFTEPCYISSLLFAGSETSSSGQLDALDMDLTGMNMLPESSPPSLFTVLNKWRQGSTNWQEAAAVSTLARMPGVEVTIPSGMTLAQRAVSARNIRQKCLIPASSY